MTPDRPRHQTPHTRLQLVAGAPAWRAHHGDALVRYAAVGCPTTAALLLSGAFDADTVPCLREALDAVRTPQVELVLLDLAGVNFGDSALVHALDDTRSRPERHILIGPLSGQLTRLLAVTGTGDVLDVVDAV
ncbi:STAS domain-containing protein [Streptomyces sp. NPDC127049]|uniref:STAS domain-containing protein n=1 Tax=Streptomyces sp. NPDC127049 TaxID=3347118 RepID=UPI00365B3E61